VSSDKKKSRSLYQLRKAETKVILFGGKRVGVPNFMETDKTRERWCVVVVVDRGGQATAIEWLLCERSAGPAGWLASKSNRG
jgi:hypothetical protein